METCIFCTQFIPKKEPLFENDLALAFFDGFPVSDGHILIITKRHTATFFDTTEQERVAVFALMDQCKEYLDAHYSPDGYNIGLNCGEAAGQSIPHIHLHLIPRYKGDVPDPRGGVRGVIPDKRSY